MDKISIVVAVYNAEKTLKKMRGFSHWTNFKKYGNNSGKRLFKRQQQQYM